MATTKIKPIKKTLSSAITYIMDEAKTNKGSLVSSFGCGVGTADIQMELTAKMGSGRGNRIAYHLIQSFSPEDNITPEKANQIGMEFAQKVLKGKHEFIIATHTDKDHIHNHIIFNATNFYNHGKYHYGAGERERIQKINDNLCRENNLSVIERTSGAKGTNWKEYSKNKNQKNWKDTLHADIDDAVSCSKSFDDFMRIMESEKNYTSKRRGQFLYFHIPGYAEDKYYKLYAKTLGDAYTEEAIKDRIEHPENAKNYGTVIKYAFGEKQERQGTAKKQVYKPDQKRINLIVDISKNLKAKQSVGYEQALVRSNINTLVKTMNFLIKNNLQTSDDFGVYYNGKSAEYKLLYADISKIKNESMRLSEKIKILQNYKRYHNLYMAAKRAGTKSKFFMEHQNEIIAFETAQMYFEHMGENPDGLNLKDLFGELKSINQHKSELYDKLNDVKREVKELDTIRKNVEATLGIQLSKEEEQVSIAKEENAKKDNIEY